MTFPALSVILVGAPSGLAAAVALWKSALEAAALTANVVAGPDRIGPDLNGPIAAARGEFVLIVPTTVQPGSWFEALWHQRRDAGFAIIGPGSHAGDAAGARRMLQRALSLPVSPDGGGLFARRSALAHAPAASGDEEWLVEALVLANSDGWPVRRITAPGIAALATRVPATALWRLWVLRNSAFSADYDERAYNSLIPLQRYWQRSRHALIHGFIDPATRILDVGCGSSRIVQDLPHSVGLDIQIKKLRRIAPRTRKVVQATLTQLPFPTHAFETLICSQVIEHVPEPLVDWVEMNRVLQIGGILVVGTPDYATFAWPVLERLYGIVHPKGYVHEHINQYTAASLRHALETHGFRVLASAYVGGGELIVKARKVAETA